MIAGQKPGQAVDPTEMRTASASNAMATTVATATHEQEKKDLGTQPKDRKPMRGRTDDRLKIFCGTANPALADEICAFLGIPRGQTQITRFSDGELYVQILENVRGADVFVLQPTCHPVDSHLMELLLMIDALKRASARRITPVIPVLRLRAPGPQGQAALAHQLQAGRRPADHRRRRPRAHRRPARPADPGLLQHSRSITCSPRRCWWAISGSWRFPT